MSVAVADLEAAWHLLRDNRDAVLLDVRTEAEWEFVGVPDLRSIGKEARFLEWMTWPEGTPNPDFDALATKHLDPTASTLVICRSGARSRAAAEALAEIGFVATYDVVDGFEGDLDAEGHRRGGWKTSGLPWIQR